MIDEQKIEQALEMARCADSNLDNLEQWQPAVKCNPVFSIVRAQLRSAIDLLEGGDGELKIEE